MKTVYKYPFNVGDTKFGLQLPVGFKFLRVAVQNSIPCIWAEVEKDTMKNVVNFGVFGTGHDIPLGALHMGTFDVGPFVFHLYRL